MPFKVHIPCDSQQPMTLHRSFERVPMICMQETVKYLPDHGYKGEPLSWEAVRLIECAIGLMNAEGQWKYSSKFGDGVICCIALDPTKDVWVVLENTYSMSLDGVASVKDGQKTLKLYCDDLSGIHLDWADPIIPARFKTIDYDEITRATGAKVVLL